MKKIVIWGAGEMAKALKKCFDLSQVTIVAYVDSDVEKHGKYLDNAEIISPLDLLNLEFDLIFISSVKYQDEIFVELKKLGINRSKIVLATVTNVEMANIMDILTDKGMLYLSHIATTVRQEIRYKKIEKKIDELSSIVTKRDKYEAFKSNHSYLKRYYEDDAAEFIEETGYKYRYIAGSYATNSCRNGERVAIEIL